MAVLTESALRSSYYRGLSPQEQRNLKSLPQLAEYTIFLSHSHKDKELVKGLVYLMAREGLSVYVDWEDSELPTKPDRTTADKIKKVIRDSDMFMLLATDNALNSKWVPWELGIADDAKTSARIVIVPASSNGTAKGSEYLDLYRRLEKSDLTGLLNVYGPKTLSGRSVKDYFRSPQLITG